MAREFVFFSPVPSASQQMAASGPGAGDLGDGAARSPGGADDGTSSIGSQEWERNFLELQEEFWALQERAAEVDKYHRAEVEALQSKLDKSRQQVERLEADNFALLVPRGGPAQAEALIPPDSLGQGSRKGR